MSYLENTPTRAEWLDRVYRKSRSHGSKDVAKSALINFDMFCLKAYKKDARTVIADLRNHQDDRVYNLLQLFVDYLDGKKPSTIKSYFTFIRKFLRSQRVKTNLEDIKEFITIPKKEKERFAPITPEQIKQIVLHASPIRQALYLVLSSSGIRIGSAVCLRKRDFDLDHDPVLIRLPASITKEKTAYETYITNEAKEYLKRIIKRKKPDDLVFGTTENMISARGAEEEYFATLRERLGYIEKHPDSSRHVVNLHCFRAFFHTKASNVHDVQYANALDGHTGYLQQYYRNEPEERDSMYKTLAPELLILDDWKAKAKIAKLEKEKSKTDKLQKQVTSQQQELGKLNNIVSFWPDFFKLAAYDLKRTLPKKDSEEHKILVEGLQDCVEKINDNSIEGKEHMLTYMHRAWEAVESGDLKLGPTTPHIETDAEREEAMLRLRKRWAEDGRGP